MTPEPCGARRPQISLSVVSPPSSPTVVAMPKTEMSRFPIHDDLPRHSAERIGLAVAAHYDSKPGLQLHTRTGRQAGVGIDEVARAQRWDSADPREAALLRYVRPLLTDGKFPQHLHEEARDAGSARRVTHMESGSTTTKAPIAAEAHECAACCPRYHEAVELVGKRWTGA